MKDTIQLFSQLDSVDIAACTPIINSRLETTEVIEESNNSYYEGYSNGVVAGMLYMIFVVVIWKITVRLFKHRVNKAKEIADNNNQ